MGGAEGACAGMRGDPWGGRWVGGGMGGRSERRRDGRDVRGWGSGTEEMTECAVRLLLSRWWGGKARGRWGDVWWGGCGIWFSSG